MTRSRSVSFMVCLVLLGAAASPARGSGDAVAEGLSLLARGRLGEARAALRRAAAAAPADPAPQVALARVYRARGRSDRELEHLEAARKLGPVDPSVLVAWGEWHLRRGRYQEAEGLFRRAAVGSAPWRAWTGQARARELMGDRQGARAVWEKVVEAANATRRPDVEALLAAGRAGRRTLDAHGALRMLTRAAQAAGEEAAEALVESGELFRLTYQVGDAIADFRRALKLSPRCVAAHVGLARCALSDCEPAEVAAQAERALQIDPTAAEAHVLLARLAVGANDLDRAVRHLDAAAAVDPNLAEAAAVRASILADRDDQVAIEALLAQRARVAPGDASTLVELGRIQFFARRYRDAVGWAQRALQCDSHDAAAYRLMGDSLVADARFAEARSYFERALKLDPFMVPAVNYLKVLDYQAEEFLVSRPRPDIVVRADALRDAPWRDLLDEAVASTVTSLEGRYATTRTAVLFVEAFPEQRWLATRGTGLPYHPALGFCTGRLVCVDSPLVLAAVTSADESWGWRRVLSHELSHSVTLSATEGRIARWFTEGLAQRDEGAGPSELRRRSFKLYAALRELPTLADLDRAFVMPRTGAEGMAAYEQAHLVVCWIEGRFGPTAIPRILTALRDRTVSPGRPLDALGDGDALTREVQAWLYEEAARWKIRPVADQAAIALALACRRPPVPVSDDLDLPSVPPMPFATSVDDVDLRRLEAVVDLERGDAAGARTLLRRLVRGGAARATDLALAGDVLKAVGEDAAAERYWRRALSQDADEPYALAGLAGAVEGAEAITLLTRAVKVLPELRLPHVRLVELLEAAGRLAEADAVAEDWCAASPDEVELRLGLAARATARGDHRASLRWRREAASLRPHDDTLARTVVNGALTAGDASVAASWRRRRWAALLAKGPDKLTDLWSRALGEGPDEALGLLGALDRQALAGRRDLLVTALGSDAPPVALEGARQLAWDGDGAGRELLVAALSSPDVAASARQALAVLAGRDCGPDPASWRSALADGSGSWAQDALAVRGYTLAGAGPDEYAGMCILALDEPDPALRVAAHRLLQQRSGVAAHRGALALDPPGPAGDELRVEIREYWKTWLKASLKPGGTQR